MRFAVLQPYVVTSFGGPTSVGTHSERIRFTNSMLAVEHGGQLVSIVGT
jgi:hypothetical protein